MLRLPESKTGFWCVARTAPAAPAAQWQPMQSSVRGREVERGMLEAIRCKRPVAVSGPVFRMPSTWQPPQDTADGFDSQSSPSGAAADFVWQFSQNSVDCGYVTSLKSNSPGSPTP